MRSLLQIYKVTIGNFPVNRKGKYIMGYRPTFKCLDNSGLEFYGTKLYGYCNELDCLSYRYLCDIGKFNHDEMYWGYGADNEITLNDTQFYIFASLYEEDMKKIWGINDFNWKNIQYGIVYSMMKYPCDKLIYWG